MSARLVAPKEFWCELRSGATVTAAAQRVGVSHWTGYRWLHDAGGPVTVGLPHRGVGCPWGGRQPAAVRDVFWAALRRGSTIRAASKTAGVSRHTGAGWLKEAGGVRPRVSNPDLEAAVEAGSGPLSFVDRCRIEDLIKVNYKPAAIADLLGRARSTITRELGRGQPATGGRYRAMIAQNRIDQNRRRAGVRPNWSQAPRCSPKS
jgi:IS30 family transposase